MDRIKVLFLTPVGVLGGGERSLLDLVASLRALAPHVDIGLVVGGPGPLVEAATRLGADVRVLELPQRVASLGDSQLASTSPLARLRIATTSAAELAAYGARLRGVFKEFSPSVIHSNGIKMHLLAAAARPRGTPVVWHVRDFLGERAISARFIRLGQRRVDLAITNSRAVADDLQALAPALEARVMYNAIDTESFSPEGPCASLDDLSGAAPFAGGAGGAGGLRIGLIGTYARWKGHDVFFESARRLLDRSDLPPMRFYVVGGPLYATGDRAQYSVEELRALVASHDMASHVAFVPFQHHLEEVYRALDIVVHASTRPEPFGRTIVEAMASGRAVVVSRAGGAAELYDEGVDALGTPPGDSVAMAECIARLALDASLRRDLGLAARRTAEARFSRGRLGAELLAIYADLFARLRGAAHEEDALA